MWNKWSVKQSKHIVPVVKQSPVLLSNGVEQVIQYHLSDDFSVVAKDDGEIVEINNETGLVIIKYKNGETKTIDTSPKVVKNGKLNAHICGDIYMNLL